MIDRISLKAPKVWVFTFLILVCKEYFRSNVSKTINLFMPDDPVLAGLALEERRIAQRHHKYDGSA